MAQETCHEFPSPLPAAEAPATGNPEACPSGRLQAIDILVQHLAVADQYDDPVFLVSLIDQANRLSAWPLALYMQDAFAQQLSDTERVTQTLLAAAEAAFCMSLPDKAREYLRKALLLNPRHRKAYARYNDTLEWERFCMARGMPNGVFTAGNDLYLQLLGYHHCDSFLNIYSDNIADLCQLPRFYDFHEWEYWLWSKYQDEREFIFAVTHECFGIVGMVSLVVEADAGFLYYWIGDDYQGRGLGPDAVGLLLEEAGARWGLETYYAKVFDYNDRSRSALGKLGFDMLNIRAGAPFQDELYYRKGPDIPEHHKVSAMEAFYRAIGCDKNFLRLVIKH